ncbi:unnamed protein product [Moneuplotes crassus]|uniref:Phosphatidic acid phosphatase type 2/haloperoxidase domain-containing protein n=1 Tax=Euplotes crassus TaxID=5936 RepID=A0AAD1UDQ8_EUPCR|nr:unnamed protein product [Moneuplotes crassus]
MSNLNTITFIVVAIIFFLVVILGHYFFRGDFYQYSANELIPRLQYYTNGIWSGFNHFIYAFGWELLWIIVAGFYAKFNRVSSAFLLTSTCKFIAFVSLLKMFWNDPAPYMDKDFIRAGKCNQDTFQTPTLEVALPSFAYCMMFYLAYDWIDIRRPRVKRNDRNTIQGGNDPTDYEDEAHEYFLHESSAYQQMKENDFSYWLILALIIFGVFMIAFSSMYLGINTIDQVFYAMFLGHGIFCVSYFFIKDWAIERYVLISELMIPVSQIVITVLQQIVLIIILIVVIRVYYGFQVSGFTVNPHWKSEHVDKCKLLPFPGFFDKEMGRVYNFLFLDLGVIVGIAFDSLLLGGTRVDYNQLRESEDRNSLVGFIFRYLITIVWIALSIFGLDYLLDMLVHHWLFIIAIPYFVCGFALYTFMKYIFELVGATRPEIHPIPEIKSVEPRKAN